MTTIKLKQLVAVLEQVKPFGAPRYELEQYGTSPELAASILFAVATAYGDVAGLHVADLGCGTGILGIAAAVLGAAHVTAVDVDGDALAQAAANATAVDVDADMSFVRADVIAGGLPFRSGAAAQSRPAPCAPVVVPTATSAASAVPPPAGPARLRSGPFDVAVLNPPFGTRRPGADVAFVRAALEAVARDGRVYSLHKSSTRAHLVRTAAAWGVGVSVVAELRFALPAAYAFHREASVDVAVDLLRFVKGDAAAAVIAGHDRIPAPAGRAAEPAAVAGAAPRARGGGGGGGGSAARGRAQ